MTVTTAVGPATVEEPRPLLIVDLRKKPEVMVMEKDLKERERGEEDEGDGGRYGGR